jgi:hypothetical protein
VIDNPGLLFDELAGREDGKIGNAAYRKSCSELLVFISIDFEDDGMAGHILCGAGNLGGGRMTRAAPLGPKIDEDRNAGVLDDLIEERSIDL